MAASVHTVQEQFTLFPRLPAEVRFIIWEHACSEERIIPLLPGLGHLFPITHPMLAVPPVLHTCSESRRIALKHYNLAFQPRVYTNRDRDQLMLHICFPHELIDFTLYRLPEAGFNWDESPRRLAVLLDDISYHQSDQDASNQAWHTDPTWRKRLQPFQGSFTWSLRSFPPKLEELTLLVLPPLTARPNPVAHRFELVEGVPELSGLGSVLTRQLRDRVHQVFSQLEDLEEWTSPVVRVRQATCSVWASDDAAARRHRHRAGFYADLEFGNKPVRQMPGTFFGGAPQPFCTGSRERRIRHIRRDLGMLRQRFCPNTGLGSYLLWEQGRYMCGTSMMNAGINYRATKQPIWWDGEEELAKWKEPEQPIVDFDFDKFLRSAFSLPPSPPPGGGVTKAEEEEEEEEEEGEEEGENSLEIEALRLNGLVYYT